MRLSRRIQELEESTTLAAAARAAKLQAEGLDIVGFGVGEPDFPTPTYIVEACIEALRAGKTKYARPAAGIAAARKAVCAKLARENKLSYQPEQVIIDAGGKMVVYLAVQSVVDPGDEVIIPVPFWVSYPPIVKLAGGIPVFVVGSKSRDFKITPEQLQAAITQRTRMFIFNSPSNPSGVMYSPQEVRALAAVLEKHDIVVLADEIYDQLVFDGVTPLSIAAASHTMHQRTITMNAASKSYSMTGWRIGYAAGPKPIIDGMIKLQSQTTSGAATFSQEALAAALTADQSEVCRMREEFARRARIMWERLSAMPGVVCPRPAGAFYCFPDVSQTYAKIGVRNSLEWTSRLLDEALVAVVPGAGFGMDQHVRLSFACSPDQLEKGLSRIEQFLAKYK